MLESINPNHFFLIEVVEVVVVNCRIWGANLFFDCNNLDKLAHSCVYIQFGLHGCVCASVLNTPRNVMQVLETVVIYRFIAFYL